MDGLSGSIVVSPQWPGEKLKDSYALGGNWWSDSSDKSLFRDKWQGAATVEKWREDVLSDWAERWNWLKD